MIDYDQLRQFIAVAEEGTLSAAAQALFLSQPALTRSMQRLEEELGVALFDRAKSKVSLNENGRFFLGLCKKLTQDLEESVVRLREFDRRRRTVFVGACAPAPFWELVPVLSTLLPGRTISTYTKDAPALARDLFEERAALVVTHTPVEGDGVLRFVLGTEKLLLNVPATHPLSAYREGVTFAQMARYSFLLYAQIGDWEEIVRREMPGTHFIVQEDWDNFVSLARISALPSFSSDLVLKHFGKGDGMNVVPILDESAQMTFYCHILRRNREEFRPLLERYL